MTTPEDGIELLDVRSKWEHEALNFTPWLARNLGLLSEATGLKLELVQEEAAVGPFSCDILARVTGSEVMVAIENQLEWSDHSHFGQMLSYTAGHKAGIGIWVAPHFRYEHAATLHWLNQWTRDGLSFYGVRIELVAVGDSEPEPRLRTVVSPDGWDRDITQPPGAYQSPRSQQFQVFFQPLIDQLVWEGFANRAIQMFDSADRAFPSNLNPGIWYIVSLEGNYNASTTLHIRTENMERTKRIFDELHRDKDEIEASITLAPGQEWRWNRHPSYSFSSVNVGRNDASIYDPPEKLAKARAWMLEMLPKLKEIFDPRLAEIFSNLPDRGSG